jgi:hypothetical protein
MVITTHIAKWNVTRVLVDNGSQVEILFLWAFNQMGYDRRKLKEVTKPLYDFGGKGIEPVGSIPMLVSFGSPRNSRKEFITFDIVNMHYPYNVIFGTGLLNTFKAALHSAYLCLKVLASLGVISVHSSKKDARNIEQGSAPGHINVHFLWEAEAEGHHNACTGKDETHSAGKTTIEAKCDTKRVVLDPRVPDKTVLIAQNLSPEEEMKLLRFLDNKNDVFIWTISDLTDVSRKIIWTQAQH